ncbi:Dps family protein [Dyella choica]|uniref:Dps family protein n=1 Tax=Dyella choica TaxID=1927959 RepID=UPI0018AD52ED|nr:ferritin-like domain-containing protein [Dyella choica]
MFALFFKTKNFHWPMTGPHFRNYHQLLDAQSMQIFAATDPIAERVRKLGATSLRSMVQAAGLQRSEVTTKMTWLRTTYCLKRNLQPDPAVKPVLGGQSQHSDAAWKLGLSSQPTPRQTR